MNIDPQLDRDAAIERQQATALVLRKLEMTIAYAMYHEPCDVPGVQMYIQTVITQLHELGWSDSDIRTTLGQQAEFLVIDAKRRNLDTARAQFLYELIHTEIGIYLWNV